MLAPLNRFVCLLVARLPGLPARAMQPHCHHLPACLPSHLLGLPALQVMEPSAAQLSAATLALINTLVARQGHPRGLLRLAQAFSFARWGLEGYVIAESNKLTGGRAGGVGAVGGPVHVSASACLPSTTDKTVRVEYLAVWCTLPHLPARPPAGVWLLARCADLMGLEYDVRRFGLCLLALFGLGMMFR